MYEANPVIRIQSEFELQTGLEAIAETLKKDLSDKIIAIEMYPGVTPDLIESLVRLLEPTVTLHADRLFKSQQEINELLARDITDDRILGRRTLYRFEDLLDDNRIEDVRAELQAASGLRVIWGTGASLVGIADEIVYADMTRWEIILRYRTTAYANWMADNFEEDPNRKIKRSYFVEWILADKLKQAILPRAKWYLDSVDDNAPKLVETAALSVAYEQIARQPFRLKPFFDEGVWGGYWMQEALKVDRHKPNLAWSFDGVPEENSLLLGMANGVLETPAQNLVFAESIKLMGERVYGRFGSSFPIRFDLLDTMGGQNLSLQVHPTTDYIQNVFGMPYTQDESYYIMTAKPDTYVYAGLKAGIDREQMKADLYAAANGEIQFDADKYVNRIPVETHDHISYPGGTIHCSGADMVVLEISSTPNRFTFKLWDWDRVDLDGLPRPINLEHGLNNIQWNRDTDYVYRELYNRIEVLDEGEGYRVERTGLHRSEYIDTIRRVFKVPVVHKANGSVRMLNLVGGQAVIVESVDGSFEALKINYAETFIVPAAVGDFIVRPAEENPDDFCITIEASVR